MPTMSLNAGNREIRLARLLPKRSTQESNRPPAIHISLRKVSLNDKVEYTALSYVWGDANDTIPILVDGSEFLATRNLVAALTELQLEEEEVTLWVDALCIRQADNEEKAGQIRMMKQIYEAATTTLVWLGEEAEGSGDVMEMLTNFAARPDFAQAYPSTTGYVALYKMFVEDPGVPINRGDPRLVPIQSAMKALLNREYWFRVWCLQEISVCKNTVVACGGYRLDIDAFGKIVDQYIKFISLISDIAVFNLGEGLLQQAREDSPFLPAKRVAPANGAKGMTEQRVAYRNAINGGQASPVLVEYLLYAYTSRGIDLSLRSTDPRDMVYGLISLASDADALCIQPDYKKTCEQVFLDTWSAILQQSGSHLLLWTQSWIGATTTLTSDQTLPSWVPDWRRARWRTNLISDVYEGNQFLACGRSHCETQWVPTDNPRILAVKGVEVDGLQEVGTSIDLTSDPFGSMAAILDELNQILQSSASAHPDDQVYTTEAIREAVWRIPVCDLDVIGTQAKSRINARAGTAIEECFRSVQVVIASYSEAKGESGSAAQLSATLTEHLDNFVTYLGAVNFSISNGRRLFLTSDGWVGLGPGSMMSGDKIVILFGCRIPFVLRPSSQDENRYILLGDAYVHGLMDGEFMEVEREETVFHLC